MVKGMRPPPKIVGRQRQHAYDTSDPVIGEPMPEECAMTAIVLDNEQPNKKAGGGHRQQQIKAISEVERKPHR